MKKIFTLFLALVASVGTVFADIIKIGDLYYWLDETNLTAEVTSENYSKPYWTTNITTADIPSSVIYEAKTYSVTSIGNSAFRGCANLTSITIPNSITSIGYCAFSGCSGLTSIEIPNSVISIGENAFSGCSGLTSVTIPNSVTIIESYAFQLCTGLTSITIPNSVTIIEDCTFDCCKSLTSLTIPSSITSIKSYAFRNCTSLTSVTIPNSVTSIGNYAFSGCSSLTSVTIPNSVTSIDISAFISCTSLNEVEAPAMFFDISESSWLNYTKRLHRVRINAGELSTNALLFINRSYKTLKSLDVSAVTNTEFEDEAFKGCYNLETLVLPASLQKVSYMMVAGCKNLKSIDIPAPVEEIDQSAFEDCRSLETITFGGKQPASIIGKHFAAAAETSQLKRIGNWAFYNAHELQRLEIPEGVTEIGDGAFYGCTYLEDLTIPATVHAIGDNCFALCAKLDKIVVYSVIPPAIEAKTFFEVKRQIPVYVPDECVEMYKDDQYWREFNIQGISHMQQGIDEIDASTNATKILHNGQILILRGEKVYTITGQEVK